MAVSIFERIYNEKDVVGLQCKPCYQRHRELSEAFKTSMPTGAIEEKDAQSPQKLILAWISPYASMRQNDWLEKRMKRLYIRYYKKVLYSNMGLFW